MKTTFQTMLLTAFLLCAFLGTKTLQAQEKAPAQASETGSSERTLAGKVTISADRMEMTLKKIARLDGNVEVLFRPEGETLESLRKQFASEDICVILNADHMTVFFPGASDSESAEEESSGRPDRIQATGRVRIHTPDGKSATGDQAAWDLSNGGNIVLEGKCTVVADGRVMSSSRISYDIRENRFDAARAVITLPVETRKKSGGAETLLPGLKALPKAQPKDGGK